MDQGILSGSSSTEMRWKTESLKQILGDWSDKLLILLLVLCELLIPSMKFFSVPSFETNICVPFLLYSNTREEKDICGTGGISLYHINIQTILSGGPHFPFSLRFNILCLKGSFSVVLLLLLVASLRTSSLLVDQGVIKL